MTGLPKIHADMNSVESRPDGMFQVSGSADCGCYDLRLRQPVRVGDGDYEVDGVVCGVMDNGRGLFYIVEFEG